MSKDSHPGLEDFLFVVVQINFKYVFRPAGEFCKINKKLLMDRSKVFSSKHLLAILSWDSSFALQTK